MTTYKRTIAALALAGAAITLPCAAWYMVGSREAAREVARLTDEPVQAARRAAQQAAVGLAVRLEALRELEASRPFLHYQHRYHDDALGCACAAFKISPLADGSNEPLIRTHFQIDAAGRLTLPTLESDPAAQEEGEWNRTQRQLQAELEPSGALLARATRSRPERDEAPLFHHVSEEPNHVPGLVVDQEHDVALLSVGPFRWRTLQLGGTASLVALREVTTTEQELVQGFVVSHDALEVSLGAAAFPMRLRPGPATGKADAVLPIPGAAWTIEADASVAQADAHSRAVAIGGRFLGRFALGTFGALLAGLSMVGLVWQTERLAQQRARFAAAAAHELRTPLASLRLHGDMLAEGLGDPDHRQQYARRVADEAGRLGRVVSNVLGYTRLEQGAVSLRREPGDLVDVIQRSAEKLRPGVEAAGGRLEVSIVEPVRSVAFDADAVHQIVQNLVDNAEKYSRRSADRTILLVLESVNDGVALSVSDQGPGVPKHLRRRLFRPFARGETSNDPAGLGLGLSLVEALARAHGGRVSYREGAVAGATFTVVLPV